MRKLKNSELERISVENFKSFEKTPIVVVLDNVRSALNVGSSFRTSDAFRVEKIYLCGITAKPPHREIHKTALGATESMNWKYFQETKEAIIELKNRDYEIIGVEQVDNSISLNKFHVNTEMKYALVFGNEVKGIDTQIIDLCDKFIEIPQIGTKHSLNITVSLGITVWDLYSKLTNSTLKLY
jgi:tRNA G18 (ribose-2'-O)-methylase SpoU